MRRAGWDGRVVGDDGEKPEDDEEPDSGLLETEAWYCRTQSIGCNRKVKFPDDRSSDESFLVHAFKSAVAFSLVCAVSWMCESLRLTCSAPEPLR